MFVFLSLIASCKRLKWSVTNQQENFSLRFHREGCRVRGCELSLFGGDYRLSEIERQPSEKEKQEVFAWLFENLWSGALIVDESRVHGFGGIVYTLSYCAHQSSERQLDHYSRCAYFTYRLELVEIENLVMHNFNLNPRDNNWPSYFFDDCDDCRQWTKGR